MGEPAAAEPAAAQAAAPQATAARDERDVLLATKLHMPRPRPDLAPRPRLAEDGHRVAWILRRDP